MSMAMTESTHYAHAHALVQRDALLEAGEPAACAATAA